MRLLPKRANKNTVAEVLKALEDVVVSNVSKGEKIVLSGFLSFERVARKAARLVSPDWRSHSGEGF